jgi:hypothetical protein
MRTEIKQVTPAIAEKWLLHNTENRRLRESSVKNLADAITRGEWKLTHQGIAFDKNGILQDGQHRLAAVIESGRTIPMMVTWDAPESNFDALDQGLKRGYSDIYGIDTGHAAVARLMAVIHNGRTGHGITAASLLPFIKATAQPYAELMAYCPRTGKIWASAPLRAAAILTVWATGSKDYPFRMYTALNHTDVEAMSPTVGVLLSQVTQQGIKAGDPTFLARCLVAFDEKRQRIKRIQINNNDAVIESVRALIEDNVFGIGTKRRVHVKPTTKASEIIAKAKATA